MSTRVSVAGASGYGGGELLRWLSGHPEVEFGLLAAGSKAGQSVDEVWPSLRGRFDATLIEPDWQLMGRESEVVFLALPHGIALEAVPVLLEGGARVVDVGADFRLQDGQEYERWYGLPHTAPQALAEAVYGLPEFERTAIANARLVANPGCYPTATILALAPVLQVLGPKASGTIIVDAKSGVSGAGRAASEDRLFAALSESTRPYKTGDHRHRPEIEQVLGTVLGNRPKVFFSPHLVPMTRGILSAIYVPCDDPPERLALLAALEEAYVNEPFVRVVPDLPETKATYGSNLCDVGVTVDREAGIVCCFGAIDNLVKGAAGQAIQNMNLMFGFNETAGLEAAPLYP